MQQRAHPRPLAGSLKRLRAHGGSLRLVAGGGRILRLFEITPRLPAVLLTCLLARR